MYQSAAVTFWFPFRIEIALEDLLWKERRVQIFTFQCRLVQLGRAIFIGIPRQFLRCVRALQSPTSELTYQTICFFLRCNMETCADAT
jgi:hypothetical protein